MNYRHAYHAGNFADVLKHVTLVQLLDYLGQKPAPYLFLETHAGRGAYPLGAAETQRAGEYRAGILRLLDAPAPPPAVARYLGLVRDWGLRDGHLESYPGSPRLALACLRAEDRAAFCELDAREAAALRAEVRADGRAQVHERDGYEALGGLLPPREKRGLVLVDPPYEATDEFERLQAALVATHARWPLGMYAAWFPIKQGDAAGRFLQRMAGTGIRRQLVVELCVQRDDSPGGLNGSGLLLINPPWRLDAELRDSLAWLREQLAGPGRGRSRISWHVPE
jgi:23S rRNA (adenine2030-N6)-methyltransferase